MATIKMNNGMEYTDPFIEEIKANYKYLYPFTYIDEGGNEIEGIIYDLGNIQYFINDQESFFKHMI